MRGQLIEVLTGVNATDTSRTHGPTHELTAIGASGLAYDAKGNLTQYTSRSPTQNYVWDYDNKMRSADIDGKGSADVSFEYDALGRQVARTPVRKRDLARTKRREGEAPADPRWTFFVRGYSTPQTSQAPMMGVHVYGNCARSRGQFESMIRGHFALIMLARLVACGIDRQVTPRVA